MTFRLFAMPLALVALLGSASVHASRWPDWAADAADDSYLERFKEDDSVLALDAWDITVRGGARSGTRYWVIHVLTEKGVDDAVLKLENGSFGGFDDVRMWVRDPSGKTVRFSEEDGFLFSTASREILDDTEILVVAPPGVRPGTKVAVEAHFSRDAELPQDLFRIQKKIPVVRSVIRVSTPDSWAVEAKIFRGEESELREGEMTWEFLDVPGRAFDADVHAPQPPLTLLALSYSKPGSLSPFRTWRDVSSWARSLFELPASGDEEIRQLAASLPPEPARAVAAAGKTVRELRYFGVELGWGGFKPRPPGVTLSRAFGDCKDKAQVMVSLLRSAGIEAYPALAIAPTDGHVPESVPSPFVFNHAIVAIPWKDAAADGQMVVESPEHGRLRIYDATMSDRSAQDVSPALEGASVLVLHPATSTPLMLPASNPEQNVLETVNQWSLDSSGALSGRTSFRMHGAMRLTLEGEGGSWLGGSELRDVARVALADKLPPIAKLEVSDVHQDETGSWVYDANYLTDGVLGEFGDMRSLELGVLLSHESIPLPSSDEPETVEYLPYLGTFKDSFEIDLPGFRLVGGRQSTEMTGSAGSVRSAVEATPDGVRVHRELQLSDRELSVQDRASVIELQNALRALNQMVLLFEAGR